MVVRNVYRLFFLRPALIETGAGLKVGATLLTSSLLLFLYLLSSSPLLPFPRLYFFFFFNYIFSTFSFRISSDDRIARKRQRNGKVYQKNG